MTHLTRRPRKVREIEAEVESYDTKMKASIGSKNFTDRREETTVEVVREDNRGKGTHHIN